MPRRVVRIRIPPAARGEVDRFIERLHKAVIVDSAVYKIESGGVTINMYGPSSQIRESIRRIKALLDEYSETSRRGLKTFKRSRINRDAGGAIPMDALSQALRLMGYKALEREDGVETNADYNTVAAVAAGIRGSISGLAPTGASRTVKKAVAVVAAVTGADPGEVLEEAIRMGLARVEDDRILPAMDWRVMSETLLRRVETGLRGEGDG